MAPTHDYDLANQSGAALRADLNNAFAAIVSLNSGATEPSTTFAYQLWYDTTDDVLKIRNAGNTAWISLRDKLGLYWADTGTADAMVVTPSPAYTAYAAGQHFLVKKSASANTGAATLKVNALAAIPVLRSNGAELLAGDLPASEIFHVAYNGSSFTLLGMPAVLPPVGQCRLTKSGANLLLSPFGGNQITIGGKRYIIPSAGVTLSASGATPGQTDNIYAFISGGAVTLERSTTGHSTDTTTGVEIKTGDSSRTLVGMARAVTGPAWADTGAQRFVISWFNRRAVSLVGVFTASRTTGSSNFVEIHTEIRNEFLTWADEAVLCAINGEVQGGTTLSITAVGIDGNEQDGAGRKDGSRNTVAASFIGTLAEGYHYSTLMGAVDGGSGDWRGSVTTADRTSLQTRIMG